MAATQSQTAVVTDIRKIEMRQFAVPEPGQTDAVLKVELCGICGSDYDYYVHGEHWPYRKPPQILGHEVVGTISAIGSEASNSWSVKEGDLVAVEAAISCQRCRYCTTGNSALCGNKRSYGMSTDMDEPPYLWGGYSQFMYLHPRANLHRVPSGVSPHVAVLFTSLANGVKWAQRAPGLRMGESIVILGPGQQGLAGVLAASTTGADPIVVVGLRKDAKRLAIAKLFGATHTVCFEDGPLDEQIKKILGPDMADVVVDASGSVAAQQVSVDLARRGGKVVLGGRTPNKVIPFVMDKLSSRGITMIGVRAHEPQDVRTALALISARRDVLEKSGGVELSLQKADLALRLIGQEVPGEETLHVALNPWSE
jgi:threonine dehydrogenase-like Zn-dependent dehydrogenase